MTDLTFSEIEKINEARERRLVEASFKIAVLKKCVAVMKQKEKS
jgi:hypothetical protein